MAKELIGKIDLKILPSGSSVPNHLFKKVEPTGEAQESSAELDGSKALYIVPMSSAVVIHSAYLTVNYITDEGREAACAPKQLSLEGDGSDFLGVVNNYFNAGISNYVRIYPYANETGLYMRFQVNQSVKDIQLSNATQDKIKEFTSRNVKLGVGLDIYAIKPSKNFYELIDLLADYS